MRMSGCKWRPQWQQDYPWAAQVEGKSNRVFCTSCHSDFNCDRGIYELKRHEKNSKHAKNEAKKASEVEKGVKTISITESLKKAEAKNVEVRKTKDAALKAEAMLSNLGATHNLPSSVFDCLAELLPKIITDSEIVKQMSLHRTAASWRWTRNF